jgi:sulfite exporter TauE/SafE
MIEEQREDRHARVRGWVLVVIGLFLILVIGAVTWLLAPRMLNPGVEIEGSTFSGTPDQALLIFGLFGIVTLFGIGTLANGVILVATGRRNRALTIMLVTIATPFLVLGWALRKNLIP